MKIKVTSREQLSRGLAVEVPILITPTLTKRKRATVIDIERKAATLEFEDGEVRKLPFSKIEIEVPDVKKEEAVRSAPLKASIGERVKLVAIKQQHPARPVRVEPVQPPELEITPPPVFANDDFSHWLAMGKEMLKPLEQKLEELNEEEQALQDRLKEIAAERAATKAKHDQIARVIARVT